MKKLAGGGPKAATGTTAHSREAVSASGPVPETPPSPARLFLVGGQPRLTRRDQQLLAESERLIKNVDIARGLLIDGVALDDPEKCLIAARSLMHIGLFLNDFRSVQL